MREFLKHYGPSILTDLETYVACLLSEPVSGVE
jgi:hypothetical protein